MFLFCLRRWNHFLQISFFHRYFRKASCAACGETWGCEFAAMFVTFVFISYFVLQICVILTRDTSLVSRERKTDKICIFSSEAAVCWCSSKQVFLKKNLIFTGKQLYWSLFLACNVIKIRFQCRRFPENTAKILRTAIFIEHFWWKLLFLETTVCECSIFWMKMMICINLVNSVLFWLGVVPGRLH